VTPLMVCGSLPIYLNNTGADVDWFLLLRAAERVHDEPSVGDPPRDSGGDRMNRDAQQFDDGRLPGLTVQRTTLFEELHARLFGTVAIDPSTNCLVLRMPGGKLVDGVVVSEDRLIDVAWPVGWSVGIRDGKVALIDLAGQVVGYLGDEVSVGGGFVDVATANVVSCTGKQQVFLAFGLTRS
jgi:hypothetical protein